MTAFHEAFLGSVVLATGSLSARAAHPGPHSRRDSWMKRICSRLSNWKRCGCSPALRWTPRARWRYCWSASQPWRASCAWGSMQLMSPPELCRRAS